MKKRCLIFSLVLMMVTAFAPAKTKVFAEGEVATASSLLYISAINPGYKIDGISNVGEMIEIRRRDKSDVPISLAGTVVGYTNSSGGYSKIFEFPENSWMAGENILLRLASSPWSELAAENYTKTLAMSAGLTLIVDEKIVDRVCWLGEGKTMKIKNKEGEVIDESSCVKEFNSDDKTTLVLEDGKWKHVSKYEPQHVEKNYYKVMDKNDDEDKTTSQCRGMMFTEILSYYESAKSEQFIELYNTTDDQILLDGCKINYKNKSYTLSGVAPAEKYFVYHPDGFTLTKNPTNYNEISLVDTDGKMIDAMMYPNGQRKGTTYAFLGYDEKGEEIWRVTYAPTPGEANDYQEFKTCEAGKVINEVTGNCVKVTTVTEKVCPTGSYLNIITGRCNKIKAETSTTKTCQEGYYLNPETNRCRKIQENTGANYELSEEKFEEGSGFVAVYALFGVVAVGAVYLVYEFRTELKRLIFRRSR